MLAFLPILIVSDWTLYSDGTSALWRLSICQDATRGRGFVPSGARVTMNASEAALDRALAPFTPLVRSIAQAKENCLPVPSVGRENGGGPT